MATVHLFLSGIRASGRHGANEGERDEPQEFVVDLDVEVDAAEDELGATADYRELAATAREVVEKESFVLLETLAEAVATRAAELPGALRATAVVHKPAAMRSIGIDGVAAAASAGRPTDAPNIGGD
ncbi:MAG: dihydroneopterin aldolase [Actinomycetota bacterium]|nr:dihydroneopterin aldolase [Actinomycetota bacterium]